MNVPTSSCRTLLGFTVYEAKRKSYTKSSVRGRLNLTRPGSDSDKSDSILSDSVELSWSRRLDDEGLVTWRKIPVDLGWNELMLKISLEAETCHLCKMHIYSEPETVVHFD